MCLKFNLIPRICHFFFFLSGLSAASWAWLFLMTCCWDVGAFLWSCSVEYSWKMLEQSLDRYVFLSVRTFPLTTKLCLFLVILILGFVFFYYFQILTELGGFEVKESKFRREMEKLRNQQSRDLTLEVKNVSLSLNKLLLEAELLQ